MLIKIVFRLFPFVFIFAVGGASLATFLPSEVLKPLVIVILTLVLIYTILRKNGVMSERSLNLLLVKRLPLYHSCF